MKTINVGMVGYAFMGKAHSNAWLKVAKFFDLPARPVMKAVCGRSEGPLKAFQQKWGWESTETDWRKLIKRDDIDLIDICTPNSSHSQIAIAAAKAGKHIACEKPLGMNAADAKKMVDAVKAAGVKNMVWFNYRRVPAVSLAKQIIDEGRLGEIYHVRASYLQDWIMDPAFPLVWRLQKGIAGSGAHGDLNAHIIDMCSWLVGRIDSVTGLTKTFVKERPSRPGCEEEGQGHRRRRRALPGEVRERRRRHVRVHALRRRQEEPEPVRDKRLQGDACLPVRAHERAPVLRQDRPQAPPGLQ